MKRNETPEEVGERWAENTDRFFAALTGLIKLIVLIVFVGFIIAAVVG